MPERRKLAAIMFTDIQDFTRRMSEQEQLGLTLLRTHNEIMDAVVKKHSGTVVKNIGDAYLVDFNSAVNAVQAAIDAQSEFASYNEQHSHEEKILVRVCIHLGDVVIVGNDMFGDGVNVASRLQSLTPPGAICISRDVFNQVKSKIKFDASSLGLQELKGVPDPVEVFQIFTALVPQAVAPTTQKRLETTETKKNGELSIAVLPFANWSEDKENEYFSDGITEDIITDLAKISSLRVTSRNSVFTYKGKNVDVQQVGKELNVRYVLEGSVRKAGNRLRVTAQLIDSANNFHLWAERFDRELKDIFEIQDEISQKIAEELKIRLTNEQGKAITHRQTENLQAYDLYLKGLFHSRKRTKNDSDLALQYFRQALDLDPAFATAHSALAFELRFRFSFGLERDPVLMEQARNHASRAFEIDPKSSSALLMKGLIEREEGKLADAIQTLKHAFELNANDTQCLMYLGNCYRDVGDFAKAAEFHARALDLEPTYFYHPYNLWVDYWEMRRRDEMAALVEKAASLEPRHFLVSIMRGIQAMLEGKEEEAVSFITKAIELDPSHIDSYAIRGIVHKHFGRFEESYNDFRFVLDRSPNSQLGILQSLPLFVSLRKFDDAFSSSEREISRKGLSLMRGIDARTICFLYRGLMYRQMGDEVKGKESFFHAKEIIQANLAQFPQSPALRSTHGLVLAVLGEFDAAVKEVQQAIESAPWNYEHLYDLARVYALQGNKAKVLQWLQKSFESGKKDITTVKIDTFFEPVAEDTDFLSFIVLAHNKMLGGMRA